MTPKTGDSKRSVSQECGVEFYIGPEETSQQASKRRETLRRSINAAKKKGSVWQRKVVNGNRYACKSKLCVKIVFVRQSQKMLGQRVCRDKHNVNSA